jgi:predicted permease
LTHLWQDLRSAIRGLRASRGFTAAAVVTLALGIGANAAIFSAVRAVLLKPLPFRDPDRLVGIWDVQPEVPFAPGAAGQIADWQAQSRSFEAIAYSDYRWYAVAGIGDPERILAAAVSPGFFSTLGLAPAFGRLLSTPSGSGGSREVVLSQGLWRRRFGERPDVLGRTVRLDGENYTIVGVMPRRFNYPDGADLWTALALTPAERLDRTTHTYQVVGRLKAGIPLSAAQQDLHAIAMRLRSAFPDTDVGHDVRLLDLGRQMSDEARPALWTLFGAVGFVLLIACANVANLFLARTVARRREMAVRVALGASRGRLVQQLLTESLLLAVGGGLIGLALAFWCLDVMKKLLPLQVSEATPVAIDANVLAFTLGISVLTGMLFGLAPALSAARPDVAARMDGGGRVGSDGPGRGRLRNLLVVSEIALALVLLAGAGLMLRTLFALEGADLGFPLDGAATFQLSLPAIRYPTAEAQRAFTREALARLGSAPGVAAAAAINSLPLSGTSTNGDFEIAGRPVFAPGQSPITYYRVVTPAYFAATQIPIRRGRGFAESDREGALSVALINETMVRRFFPSEDPIGQRIRIRWGGDDAWREIVGVVADVRDRQLDDGPVAETYLPYFQHPLPTSWFVVRTTDDPDRLLEPIRRTVRALDAELPVSHLTPLRQIAEDGVQPRRQFTRLLGLFGGLAVGLAALGLSSVLVYSFAQRRREIAIRLAIGANPRDILRLVVWEAFRLSRIGIAAGLVGALALTRLLAGQLYGVRAADPVSFAAAALLMAAVALGSSAIPARRAARLDPLATLRSV